MDTPHRSLIDQVIFQIPDELVISFSGSGPAGNSEIRKTKHRYQNRPARSARHVYAWNRKRFCVTQVGDGGGFSDLEAQLVMVKWDRSDQLQRSDQKSALLRSVVAACAQRSSLARQRPDDAPPALRR